MKWRKFLVPVLIIGLPIIGVSSCIIRDDQLDRNFQAVKPGMSAAEVKANMGPPSWDSDGVATKDRQFYEVRQGTRIFSDHGVDRFRAYVVGHVHWS